MDRSTMLAAASVTGELWDVIVIGGGATGLGTALDAVSRGYRTILLESGDFAQGTSSRSTKLIHGGVRYLRQGHISMVRQSLRERGRLSRNAPHIVHPLRFVLPAYHRGARWYYYAGLRAYDLLAGSLGFGSSELLSRDASLQRIPTLQPNGLRGAVLYCDGQFDDARLAVSLAQTVVDLGGVAINHAVVRHLLKNGSQVCGVVAQDQETGQELTLRGRSIVNATGVFSDAVLALDQTDTTHGTRPRESMIVPSQGSHLVLDRSFLPSHDALMIPQTDDGRVLFAIPWHGHVLLGTTDVSVNSVPPEPRPSHEEVAYLLEHAGRYLTRRPATNDIQSMFAGLRPLVRPSSSGAYTSQMSREHQILVSPSGLISVIGGKWTTFRQMGEDVVNLAAGIGSLPGRPSGTKALPIHGHSGHPPGSAADRGSRGACDETTLSSDPGGVLEPYGADAVAIRELIRERPELGSLLHTRLPYLQAQVVWAVQQEMARSVEDVLARRTRALFLDAEAASEAAPTVAALMQQALAQSDPWAADEVKRFQTLARQYRPD